jgi:hypothetical protein
VYKQREFLVAAALIMMLVFFLASCIAERKAIKEVNDLIASYDTITRDTSVIFYADTTMTNFWVTVDYYTSHNNLLKIVVTGDDSLQRRTTTYYFATGVGLIKSVEETLFRRTWKPRCICL